MFNHRVNLVVQLIRESTVYYRLIYCFVLFCLFALVIVPISVLSRHILVLCKYAKRC